MSHQPINITNGVTLQPLPHFLNPLTYGTFSQSAWSVFMLWRKIQVWIFRQKWKTYIKFRNNGWKLLSMGCYIPSTIFRSRKLTGYEASVQIFCVESRRKSEVNSTKIIHYFISYKATEKSHSVLTLNRVEALQTRFFHFSPS